MDRVDWFNYRHGLDTEATRRRTEAARPEGGLDPGHVVAARAARALGLPQPRPPEQNAAGLAVHYAIGMAPASLYAALRGRAPALTAGHGALFGLGLFLLQDELANAALGLSGPPRRYPWTAHARGLIAHLVYGVVLETACRAMGLPRRRRA
jgi:hypothetical protein